MKTWFIAVVMAAASAPFAHAQAVTSPPSATAASFTRTRWDASVGIETLALRDIARTSRPVTASPIAWEGTGPVFRANATWENLRRLHRVSVAASLSSGFEYAGPLRSTPTSDDDRARYFDARYEYRRYLFRDVLVRGFDVGAGVEGLAARTSFTRRVPPDVEMDEARTNAGIGGSVAARLRRWDRVGAEVAWTNGLVIGRRHEQWTNGVESSGGGGGWLSTLAMRVDARLSSRARVFAGYTGSGEGFLASHRSYALGRRSVAMGVTYDR